MPDIVQKTDALVDVTRLDSERKAHEHMSLASVPTAVRALPFQVP